jgi:RNA polymerase sigma factor (TIGR02999 family)
MLQAWSQGDLDSGDRLIALLYDELRRIAARSLWRERSGHTLSATALVHEAFVRIVGQRRARWEDRGKFLAVMTIVMRRVLNDHARRRLRDKRGAGEAPGVLDEAIHLPAVTSDEIVALREALVDLARLDPRKAAVVELRYFAGLSVEETATALDLSVATVGRQWRLARAWIHRELSGAGSPGRSDGR